MPKWPGRSSDNDRFEAIEILKQRYAKGEISEADYERMKQKLNEKKERNQILLNGHPNSSGLVAILDNIIFHWFLKWHHILPNQAVSSYIETVLFVAGWILLGVGVYRELKGRYTNS